MNYEFRLPEREYYALSDSIPCLMGDFTILTADELRHVDLCYISYLFYQSWF